MQTLRENTFASGDFLVIMIEFYWGGLLKGIIVIPFNNQDLFVWAEVV